MNCCRALTVNLQKVFYNSQASVGDRQYTIILFISIIFLPTILNNLNDRERGRHYHFHFVGFWRPPMPPPTTILKYCTILMTEMRDAIIFVGFWRPPMPPPLPLTPQYLTILMTEGAGITFCRILAPPPPMPTPSHDTTILNYLNDREKGHHYRLKDFGAPQ